ncbi:MAG TPA: glycosyltransferase 87 family protein [Polyangia bacterium]|nr:glycosyltransferase 87 family protein [Polyangia bacterium]
MRPALARALFCAFLAAVVASAVALDLGRVRAPWGGWDARVYCAAARAADAGKSPYVVANLEPFGVDRLSFSYPLATLAVFRPLCAGDARARFALFYGACLVVAFGLAAWAASTERVLLGVWLLGGFAGAAFCFWTLNVGLLELALFAASVPLVARKRHAAAAMAIGLAASFKLVPVLLAAPLLFVAPTRRLRVAGAAIAAPAATLGLSAVMSPAFFRDFVANVFGRIPNQHAPALEGLPDATNPTFVLALEGGLSGLGVPRVVYYVVLVALLIVAVLVTRRLRARGLDDVRLFAVGALFVLLLLPRLKPYSLPFATLPVFLLAREASRLVQVVVVLVGVWLPSLGFNGRVAMAMDRLPVAARVWARTNQTTCLFLCTALLVAVVWRAPSAARTTSPR